MSRIAAIIGIFAITNMVIGCDKLLGRWGRLDRKERPEYRACPTVP